MKQCPSCKKNYNNEDKFCPVCGMEVKPVEISEDIPSQVRFCQTCGKSVNGDAQFCPACGASVFMSEKSIPQNPVVPTAFGTHLSLMQNDISSVSGGVYIPDQGIKEMFFRYDNRLNRKRYFLRGTLIGFFGSLIVVLGMIGGLGLGNNGIIGVAVFLYLVLIVAGTMNTIRRLHDCDLSGYWCLAGIALPFLLLYPLFAKGTNGPNRYGPDPLTVPGI